jgi:predicted transcriptional regulator of viral defense system
VAYEQHGVTTVLDAAEMVGVETERVCELAEQLAKLAGKLASSEALATAGARA